MENTMDTIKSEPTDNHKEDATTDNAPSTVTPKEEDTYESKLRFVNRIAKPMASRKLTKKCYKLVKKAIKHKTFVRNGLKEVQTRIRKGETGLVLIAGDVTPIDIICHVPAVCEEKNIPYIYIPSRGDLGAAMGFKRGTIVAMIRNNENYKDYFDELKREISGYMATV